MPDCFLHCCVPSGLYLIVMHLNLSETLLGLKHKSSGLCYVESAVFSSTVCDNIKTVCSIFTNSSCLFSTKGGLFALVEQASCQNGEYVKLLGWKPNTASDFPYVKRTFFSILLSVLTFSQLMSPSCLIPSILNRPFPPLLRPITLLMGGELKPLTPRRHSLWPSVCLPC